MSHIRMIPLCSFCVTRWVEEACFAANVGLTALEQQRLTAALLARRHLILSGPTGTGKCRLAHALALAIAHGQQTHVRLIQGHPWWAARTGDVAHFVAIQTELSMSRLVDFVEAILQNKGRSHSPAVQTGEDREDYVACVERMSPVEVHTYFGTLVRELLRQAQDGKVTAPLRLFGTYDSDRPPQLDELVLQVAALVHLEPIPVR